MCRSRGRGRGRGSRPSLENDKAIGFLSNTDPDPLENHQAPQAIILLCWVIIGPTAKRYLNGVSVAGL